MLACIIAATAVLDYLLNERAGIGRGSVDGTAGDRQLRRERDAQAER